MEQTSNTLTPSVSLNGDTPRVSPLHDDIFSFKNVTTANLLDHDEHDDNAELIAYTTKWFDYRELTPLQATRQYIDTYGDIYRKHYRSNFDASAAKHLTTISVDQIWERLGWERAKVQKGQKETAVEKERNKKIMKAKRDFNGCWRGRLVADHLGMPYDIFIDTAFKMRLNFWSGHYMPQPQHLYLDWIVEKVAEKWEELQAARLYTSYDPAYLNRNYCGARHQDDYHEWLFKQAGLRSNPPAFMAQFVNDDQLPLEKVKARLDDDDFEKVMRHVLQ